MTDAPTAVPTPEKGPYRPLKETFVKRGYEYRLVKRTDGVAMYEQWNDGRLHAYEVFRIQRNDARVIAGRAVAASESPPGDEQWGRKGWTLPTREAAEARYEAAQAALEEVEGDDIDDVEALDDDEEDTAP